MVRMEDVGNMLVLDDTWLSFQDFSKAFKILQHGGMFVVGKYGLKLEKAQSGLMHAEIVAFGKTMPNKTYFNNMTSALPKKAPKPEKKKKEPPKVIDSGSSKVGGLFG